jgi:penicillin-binding protein 1A
MPSRKKVLNAQPAMRKGLVWKEHLNTLEALMHNTERWRNMEDDGIPAAEIRKSFNQPVQMKVFAWNSRRETDTVMTPLDSIKYNHQMMQTAFLAMDPMSGAVKAWIGALTLTYKFDHANINTKRQVGSSIKPLLYSDAIENAGFAPETQVQNEAQYFDGYGLVPAWRQVRRSWRGISMASALAYSLNCASAST